MVYGRNDGLVRKGKKIYARLRLHDENRSGGGAVLPSARDVLKPLISLELAVPAAAVQPL